MKKLLLSTLLSIGILFMFGSTQKAYAADICWDGGGTTNNWSEDANWAGNVEPGGSDVAVFDNGTCSGSPNKNATVDIDETSVGGLNIVSYTGTISLGSNNFAVGDFTQASGTFDLDTGSIVIFGTFTRTGGTYTADQSTTYFLFNSTTITGSTTFYNLQFITNTGVQTLTIASGTTLTATNTLTLDGTTDSNDTLDGPGGISAQGNINVTGGGINSGGDAVITINGTGSQTLDGETDSNTIIPNVTINKSTGTLSITDTVVVAGDWTYSQGTISAGSSTIIFLASTSSIAGSHTLANASIVTTNGSNTKDITSGTTLTLTGNLTIDGSSDANDSLAGPGSIAVQGNISLIGEGINGDAVISVTGTGTQTLDGEVDTDTRIPAFTINKSNGTLNITDTIVATNDWTYSQGTVSPGSSHIIFSVGTGTITGSHTLNDITFRSETSLLSRDIASGTTITAGGDLVIDGTTDNNDSLSGPGGVAVQGDFTVTTDGIGSDIPVTFTGSNNQNISIAGTTLPGGTFTINKTAGTVTLTTAMTLDATGQDLIISSGILDMSTFGLTVDDVVTINGGLRQGSGNFTASNGNVTIGTTGWWVNNSTGDIDAEGGDTITNNGYVRWDGTSAGCGGADGIALTRNGSGAVNLAGSGRWRVYDITIGTTGIYAASPALTIYSSSITGSQTGITNNGTCPNEVTWDGGHVSDNDYDETTNWTGDALPTSADLAIFDATSTDNATINIDPNDNGFQINLGYSGTITQSNGVDMTLDDQGWEQNAGTFTGGNATSDIDINSGGDLTQNGGVFTTPGGTITIDDDFTHSSGTFTASSGTVEFYPAGNNDPTVTGSTTFNDVSIADDSFGSDVTMTIASGTTMTVNGTLTFYNNNGGDELNGPGSIHAKGDIDLIDSGWQVGDIIITINGTGTQTITGEPDGAFILSTVIDKTGTLNLVDTISAANDWTYAQGTVSPGSSTVAFQPTADNTATITGSHTLNNIYFYDNSFGGDRTITIAAGTTLTASGDITFESNNSADTITGSGAFAVQGDLGTVDNGWTVGNAISMTGTNAQTITDGASNFPDGTLTINKSSNTVTLGSTLNLNGSGQDLTITDGTLANSSYALTVNDAFTINDTFVQGAGNVSATSYTVGSNGFWTNASTGDITVGTGGVTNNGTITFGDINTCGGTDNIAITSSSAGNQRAWSGSGAFSIYDVTVQDQGGSAAITAYSSQSVSGNGGNWTFDNVCPAIPTNVSIRGGASLRGGTRIQ